MDYQMLSRTETLGLQETFEAFDMVMAVVLETFNKDYTKKLFLLQYR